MAIIQSSRSLIGFSITLKLSFFFGSSTGCFAAAASFVEPSMRSFLLTTKNQTMQMISW